jgi:hypothetical protein
MALTAGYLLALSWLLLAPSDTFQDVERFPNEDKVVHCGVFLALAWLVRWSVPERCGFRGRVVVAAALAAYALGIEGLQPLLTGGDRQFEWLDMACNCAGIAVGWALSGVTAARASEPSTTGGAVR